jgi:hypothetical protein
MSLGPDAKLLKFNDISGDIRLLRRLYDALLQILSVEFPSNHPCSMDLLLLSKTKNEHLFLI